MFCGINPSECATSRLAVYVPLPTFAFAMTPFLISPVTPHQRHGRHTACAPQDTAVSLCPRTASPSDAPPHSASFPLPVCMPTLRGPTLAHTSLPPRAHAPRLRRHRHLRRSKPISSRTLPPRKVRFLFIGGTTRHILNKDVTRKDTAARDEKIENPAAFLFSSSRLALSLQPNTCAYEIPYRHTDFPRHH